MTIFIKTQTFASDLSQEVAIVVENLDAMSAVVRDVDLLALIRSSIGRIRAADSVGELQILGAVELIQHIAVQIENDDTHNLALDDHNSRLIVDIDTSRML